MKYVCESCKSCQKGLFISPWIIDGKNYCWNCGRLIELFNRREYINKLSKRGKKK